MIYLNDLLTTTGGQQVGPPTPTQFSTFCHDSRRINPGELFVTVKTEGGEDGHDYIADAIQKGAGGVLCQFPPDNPIVPCVVVPDTQLALTHWAEHVLRKYDPQVVGVTGSTGKTDTCRAIATVLATHHRVFSNPPDLSNRFGLPLSLAGLTPEHEAAVLEMACHAFRDIAHLTTLTRPNIAVITAINHTHLAYLGSLEAIAQETGHLVETLPPDGVAILNYDYPRVRAMRERTHARVVTYGLSPDADLVASDLRLDLEGLQFVVHFPSSSSTSPASAAWAPRATRPSRTSVPASWGATRHTPSWLPSPSAWRITFRGTTSWTRWKNCNPVPVACKSFRELAVHSCSTALPVVVQPPPCKLSPPWPTTPPSAASPS